MSRAQRITKWCAAARGPLRTRFVHLFADAPNVLIYFGKSSERCRRNQQFGATNIRASTKAFGIYQKLRRHTPCLFRGISNGVGSPGSRAQLEAMAAGVEAQAYRRIQSRLARSHAGPRRLGRVLVRPRICDASLRFACAAPRPGQESLTYSSTPACASR